ncbi:hypothetical protein CLV84_1868 [Neolewinella xylanilytica]|uniref:DUF8202 domain-containing protein n=1 Tax=Neolewinella xylanilytica TaxID=1514080 RepID=A0A2S6IBK2_9BACT|nr:hypothetical protein [Neolewinella xylanilytica]PPK88894.1 hypothetical protein CLV84_1868 [Neolewinella xylanilytica]
MLKSTALGLGAFFYISILVAQSGPGGVGNASTNGLWLLADEIVQPNASAVVSWEDLSGNANHASQVTASQQPVYYSTSALNGMPVVRLDGSDDRLIVDDVDILDNTSSISYFAVIRPYNLNGQPKGILGKRITYTTDIEYAYTWFFWDNRRLNLDVHTQNDRMAFPGLTFNNSTNYLLSWDFDGSRAQAVRSTMYVDDTHRFAFRETSTHLPNSNQVLAIGGLNDNYTGYLSADYAEVIHFNYALNDLERLLVNNYLAGKYGLPLTTSDVYKQDNPENGNYDFDIAGIGRMNATSAVTEARGSGVLTIRNPDDLDANEYLLWGHDGGALTFSRTNDLPPLTNSLLARTWRISETDLTNVPVSVGSVDVAIELPGYDAAEAGRLAFIVDTDNDGSFSDEVPSGGVTHLGGNTFQLNGLAGHRDGSRLTLGLLSYDASIALPVDLLTFETVRQEEDETVVLEWAVENEQDLAYYTVERSLDGSNWIPLVTVRPRAVGSALATYRYADTSSPGGELYYRLRMNDIDGRHHYSEVRRHYLTPTRTAVLYPNPVVSVMWLTGKGMSEEKIRCYDARGGDVTHRLEIRQLGDNKVEIRAEALPGGMYLLVHGADRRWMQKQ